MSLTEMWRRRAVLQIRTAIDVDLDAIFQDGDIGNHDAVAAVGGHAVFIQALLQFRTVDREVTVGMAARGRVRRGAGVGAPSRAPPAAYG